MKKLSAAFLAVVVAGLAAAAAAVPSSDADAAEQQDVRSFGQQIVGLLRSGDSETLANVFVTTATPCGVWETKPTGCEGVPDNTQVEGYLVGRLQGEASLVDRAALVQILGRQLGSDTLSSTDARLWAVSTPGTADFPLGCGDCAMVSISSPTDAVAAMPKAVVFAVRLESDGWRIHELIAGPVSPTEDTGVLTGGAAFGRTFELVKLAPPNTGTGVQVPARGSGLLWVGLTGLVTAAAGTVVLATARARR